MGNRRILIDILILFYYGILYPIHFYLFVLIFEYTPKLIQIGKNEWGIRFHSRIISRYLSKFFDFPSGCKQYTVKEPEIIKNSPLAYRKAFALGSLTFEAGI